MKRCLNPLSISCEYRVYDLLRNYRKVLKKVKEIVHRIDPFEETYVSGSVITGQFAGASDIDVLVITYDIDRKYDIMVNVYREVDVSIELHIVIPDQYNRWYSRFIKKLIKI